MKELKDNLYEATQRNLGEGLLLSGGIDSSLLAYLASNVKAFTVTLDSSGRDLEYAQMLTECLNIEHHHYSISVDEALNAIPRVIKILKTFDPVIPNDVAIYFGLKLAKKKGCKSVMTGDGGDELFVGYDFMFKLDLNDYIPKIARNMHFSSNALGKFMNIDIKQPYMDKEFVEFAINIDPKLKVKTVDGKTWGKWLMRKTFENDIPRSILWRSKMAIEHGSGITKLRSIIESKISEKEFREEQQVYPIKFWNKEHLYYYRIYREVVGEIPASKDGEKQCCMCRAGVKVHLNHCKVCGGFPV